MFDKIKKYEYIFLSLIKIKKELYISISYGGISIFFINKVLFLLFIFNVEDMKNMNENIDIELNVFLLEGKLLCFHAELFLK